MVCTGDYNFENRGKSKVYLRMYVVIIVVGLMCMRNKH